MVIHPLKSILIIFISQLFSIGAIAATITVTVDRNPVSMDESFQVTFEADGVVDGSPDFTPLDDSLHILSTSQSSNYSLINGQISSTRLWTLTVMARAPGRLTIPSISFGADSSPVAEVQVQSARSSGGDQQGNDDIFLSASVSLENPYVQSQVIYTLKLFRSIPIARASLTDPEITRGDAVIERIGDDRSYEARIDGKAYQVIERNFAIYPQSSGTVSIGAVNFMGQAPRDPLRFGPFGGQPTTIIRRAQPVTLDVRPAPASFSGNHWLPAKNLILAEEWSSDPLSLVTGEPVTRTLILSANGLTASQLPELVDENVENLRFYADRPILTNERSATGATGTRRDRAAIIPGQAGSYVLPEISIPWWNIVADRIEYAVLPERTIRVLTAPVDTGVTGAAPSLQGAIDVMRYSADENGVIPADPVMDSTPSSNVWKWISLILLVTLVYVVVRMRKSGNTSRGSDQNFSRKESINSVIKDITEYCRQEDPVKTRESLLRWARLAWPESPPLGLGDIARRVGPDLSQELHKLNNAVYGNRLHNWEADRFLQAFNNEPLYSLDKKAEKNKSPGKLEPLYKL